MKKVLSIVLAFMLVVCMLPLSLTASADTPTSGTSLLCDWTLDGTVLTVSFVSTGQVGFSLGTVGAFGANGSDVTEYLRNVVTDVVLKNIYAICLGTFKDFTLLENVTFIGGIHEIGKNAFENCKNLKSITPLDGLYTIDSYAFSGCTSLESIDIPETVGYIGDYAFSSCEKLANVNLSKNSNYTTIKDGTFYNCTSLTSITIPNNVTSIGTYAFYGCDGLTSVIIPDNVTSIGSYAFEGCSLLTCFTIPNQVKSIGDCAFGCVDLTDIYYKGCKIEWNSISIDDDYYDFLNTNINIVFSSVLGDINEDGGIKAQDALLVLQASVGKIQFTEHQTILGDVDGDGEIEARDALLVLQYAVGKIFEFPIE